MPLVECDSPKKRFIESSSFYTNSQQKDPFSEMKIDDHTFLENVPSRNPCPKCNRSRKYYCYTCYVAVKEIADRLPHVQLPIKLDIIKHPKEVDGKSTAAHAAVLANEDVTIYIYPDFPAYKPEEVLLIFPSESAISFQEWWRLNIQPDCQNSHTQDAMNKSENLFHHHDLIHKKDVEEYQNNSSFPVKKVIFIDSTWRQSKALYGDPRLKKLPCVFLNDHKSLFWRYYRGKKDSHLSTIEAVYYFMVEFHSMSMPVVPYRGQYDNLLFFFKFMYFKIRTLYDPLKLKAYQTVNAVRNDEYLFL